MAKKIQTTERASGTSFHGTEFRASANVSFNEFLKESKKHKLSIGDLIEFDNAEARIYNAYTTRGGKAMYTVGSSKHGTIEIEAEDIEKQIR